MISNTADTLYRSSSSSNPSTQLKIQQQCKRWQPTRRRHSRRMRRRTGRWKQKQSKTQVEPPFSKKDLRRLANIDSVHPSRRHGSPPLRFGHHGRCRMVLRRPVRCRHQRAPKRQSQEARHHSSRVSCTEVRPWRAVAGSFGPLLLLPPDFEPTLYSELSSRRYRLLLMHSAAKPVPI